MLGEILLGVYNPVMDASERFKILVAVMVLVTLIGLLVIIALLVIWRRYNERIAAIGRQPRSETNYADAWSEAGQRLTPAPEDHDDSDDLDFSPDDLNDTDDFLTDDPDAPDDDEDDDQDDEHK